MFLIGFIILSLLTCKTKGDMLILPYIIFPYNGEMGYLVAIAVPLELSRFNVFMSYNYEANWNLQTLITDMRGSPLFFPMVGVNSESTANKDHLYTAGRSQVPPKPLPFLQNMITRKRFYGTILDKLEKIHGLPGKACFLRAICEHAISPLSKYNGFVGDILHIMLSPFSSKHEPDMEEYYDAELTGRNDGNCKMFNHKCGISILDLISKLSI